MSEIRKPITLVMDGIEIVIQPDEPGYTAFANKIEAKQDLLLADARVVLGEK